MFYERSGCFLLLVTGNIFPVHRWGHSCLLPEFFCEIAGIFEAALEGDFGYVQGGGGKQVGGFLKAQVQDMVKNGAAHLLFEFPAAGASGEGG